MNATDKKKIEDAIKAAKNIQATIAKDINALNQEIQQAETMSAQYDVLIAGLEASINATPSSPSNMGRSMATEEAWA